MLISRRQASDALTIFLMSACVDRHDRGEHGGTRSNQPLHGSG
jgi:hypothetical protein